MLKDQKTKGFIQLIIVIIVAVAVYIFFKDEINTALQSPILQAFFDNFMIIVNYFWHYALYALKFIAWIVEKLAQFLSSLGN